MSTSISDDHNATHDSRIHDLARNAVVLLDRRMDWRRPESFANSVSTLQKSVRCLADAVLAARGHGPATDAERIGLLVDQPVVDHETDQPLIELLRFDLDAEWTEERASGMRALEQRYRAALPRFRSALVDEIPGYGRVWTLCRRAASRRWVHGTASGLTVVVLLSVAVYKLSDPNYLLELNGRVFWKSTPGDPFIEDRSTVFAVVVDGNSHDYRVTFEEPVQVASLRIDPVNKMYATEVEIQKIWLRDSGGNILDVYDDLTSWSCRNCRWLSDDERGNRLVPRNDDPFITSPSIGPIQVSGIRITMRASAKKTFWEWVTRLKKATSRP